MRPIDANALKFTKVAEVNGVLTHVLTAEDIDNAPTIEPETKVVANVTFDKEQTEELVEKAKADILAQIERNQGEWVFRNGVTCGGYYKCSKCGEVERAEKNFCPNCGARMGGTT